MRGSDVLMASRSQGRWVPDASYDVCFECLRKFTVFLRRHHCRACGHLFCKSCSSQRLPINSPDTLERVCDSCFALKSKSFRIENKVAEFPFLDSTPDSIFSIGDDEIALSFSFEGKALATTARSPLSQTLTCKCWQASSGFYGFQCAHFDLKDNRTRIRIDFPFDVAPGTLACGSIRIQKKNGFYIGAFSAAADFLPSKRMRVIEEIRCECINPKTEEKLYLNGSLGWILPKDQSGDESSTKSKFELKSVGAVLQAELDRVHKKLSDVLEDERKQRESLEIVSSEIIARKQSDGSSKTTAGTIKVRLDEKKSDQTVLSSLRYRRSLHWEVVQSLLSQRNELATKAELLTFMVHCSKRLQDLESVRISTIPLQSCFLCSKCHGTISC